MHTRGRDETQSVPVIALVDDDPIHLRLIGRALGDRGMKCLLATKASELIDQIDSESPPDIFLLDYHLSSPRETGLSLCRSMRLRYARPVVMLTGDSNTETVVSCLEAGAEQYITKPCSIDELVARLRVVLRERSTSSSDSRPQTIPGQLAHDHDLTLGNLKLQRTARTLRNAQNSVLACQLTEKELSLMQLFLQSPDQTLSREDAFFKIYNYEMDPENRSVDILASKLRKKIAKVDSSLQIQALRGRGYRLIAQERVAKEEPMSGMSVTKHETPEETPILDPDQLARTLESNDQALQREFYEVFLAHASTEIESLAAAGGNPDQVRASAHQLKSSSQSVGTPRLTQALIALEKLAKSTATDSAALKAAALDVKNIWLETSQAIESRIIELNTR